MDYKYEKFLCEASLYDKLDISIDDMEDIVKFLKGQVKPDVYCVGCQENRVFNAKIDEITTVKNGMNIMSSPNLIRGESPTHKDVVYGIKQDKKKRAYEEFIKSNRITTLNYKCSKDEKHKLVYIILLTESYIMKIGQYPSYRDIESPQIKKFQKVLGEYYLELKRAIGLHACNVGIGSFVYLRRIIEKLVYDTFKEAETSGKLTEQDFEFQPDGKHRNSMEEKIKLLKGFLPDLITDHPKIYGVVSKGIHELSEDECLEYFPVLKNGIIMILDDIVAKKEKERAATEYKKSLSKIISDLK